MNNYFAHQHFCFIALILMLLVTVPVWAQPVLNPANGHYYDVVASENGGWTWQQASDDAQTRMHMGQVGHLVTITSQQENEFLTNDMDIPTFSWIGGFQPTDFPEPPLDEGWQWVTGEPWSFTSWSAGEPNSAAEDCAHWWEPDGTWNDITCTNVYANYVIEFGIDEIADRATFAVEKIFDDGNPAEVEVTISCNTGLPLQQTTTISDGDGVVFVVRDFNNGELDCEIFEDPVPTGYIASYAANPNPVGPEPCAFEDITFGESRECLIFNNLQQVQVEVTKEWIDENSQFNPINVAQADYFCVNEAFNQVSGSLFFSGNPDTELFPVFPNWNGSTTCTVTESFLEGGVETDDSDCQGLNVTPGNGASCTIVNTRLFEGIPTLSSYGLGLLAMLMLGLGFVTFRRMA